MPRYLLVILLLFFQCSTAFPQTDSSDIRISLLTCTPGEDLYSTFGHSALRVTDGKNREDLVFNYGTFDFDEPGFYLKFIRGKLTFYLSTEEFTAFKNFYIAENRGITEQVLNLSPREKNKIIHLLQQNLEAQNRFYKYDFLFDNCTTRLRDLVEKTADTSVAYGKVVTNKTRFRQLIYEYLDNGDKQWSKLGIDLLLGSKTDAVMMPREVMFLPEYLMNTFQQAKIGGVALVSFKKPLYSFSTAAVEKNWAGHPEVLFSILFVVIAILSFSKNKTARKFIAGFDGCLFFLTGLLGLLILFMWFGTDHLMCSNNFNLLWAWPTHAVLAFYINKPHKYEKNYFRWAAILHAVMLSAWFFLPQHMNISMIPVVMLLALRSAMISSNIIR